MGEVSTKSSNPPSDGDFTFEEVQVQERDDVFRATVNPRKRKLSRVELSSFWGAPSCSSSSTAISVTVRFTDHNTQEQRHSSFVMPMTAIGSEALDYLCFIPTMAKDIFDLFQNRPNPDTVMDFVTRHVEQI